MKVSLRPVVVKCLSFPIQELHRTARLGTPDTYTEAVADRSLLYNGLLYFGTTIGLLTDVCIRNIERRRSLLSC